MKTAAYSRALLVLCAGCLGAIAPSLRAEEPAGGQFDAAYSSLRKADEARERQDWPAAAKLYREALDSYVQLSTRYVDWQPTIVQFRIDYCNEQLEAALRLSGAKDGNATNAAGPVAAGLAAADAAGGPRPPDDIGQLRQLAVALVRAGDTNGARRALMKGVTLSPDDTGVRLLLGVVQCAAGRYEDALFVLEPLASEAPADPAVQMALGTAHVGLGDMSAAAADVRRALDLDPDLAEAHFDLAQILLGTTPPDLKAARDHYRRALELGAPPDPSLDRLIQ